MFFLLTRNPASQLDVLMISLLTVSSFPDLISSRSNQGRTMPGIAVTNAPVPYKHFEYVRVWKTF